MTKEEAKKILDPETSRDALLEYEDGERINVVNEACRVAVSALCARQTPAKLDRSRWGCEVCLTIGAPENWEDGIKFCPRCGKPLTGEAWAELERRINDG